MAMSVHLKELESLKRLVETPSEKNHHRGEKK